MRAELLSNTIEIESISVNWKATFGTSIKGPNAVSPTVRFTLEYPKSELKPVVSFVAPNNDLFYKTWSVNNGSDRRLNVGRGGEHDFRNRMNSVVAVAANSLATIRTGDGGDIVFAGQTNSQMNLSLGAGNDLGIGSQRADTLRGEAGHDCLAGLGGDDKLYGDDGNDTIYGGLGNDRLHGDKGNDYLYSGKGNDHLWGGDGRDIFVFEEHHYQERGLRNLVTIEDFGRGNDLIDLRSFEFPAIAGIVDRRFVLRNEDGYARIFINTAGTPRDGYELSILVRGMSYDKFVSGPDSYMKYLVV